MVTNNQYLMLATGGYIGWDHVRLANIGYLQVHVINVIHEWLSKFD